MRAFIDKAKGMSKHALDSAVIIDSNGNYAGKIICRYTDATTGWNIESGAWLLPAVTGKNGYFNGTRKADTYSKASTVFKLLSDVGATCFDTDGTRFSDTRPPVGRHIESTNNVTDIVKIKIGRKQYRILWV